MITLIKKSFLEQTFFLSIKYKEEMIAFMRVFIITALLFLSFQAIGQKVYSVEYASQADVKIYVVEYESQADLKVYKVNYESQTGNNDGKWFFTRYESQAQKKVFFVSYDSQADLKIYFVDYESQAGWKHHEKKALLY